MFQTPLLTKSTTCEILFDLHVSDTVPPARVQEHIANDYMQTAWGSRDGADDDDAYRMIRVTQKQHEASEYWPDYRANILSLPHRYDPRDCDRALVSSLLNKPTLQK